MQIPKIVAALVGLSLSSGCAASLEYRSRAARPHRVEAKLMVSDVVDGRDRGAASDLPLVYKKERDKSMKELRRAVRTHAQRSGIVANDAQFVAAPRNEAELAQALDKARAAGATALLVLRLEGLFADGQLSGSHGVFMILNYVMFIGLVPSLVAFSIPNSGEYASAKVGAFLVDPSTGNVFAAFDKAAVYDDDTVTAWGFSPHNEMKGVLFDTMEHVFAEAARLATSADPRSGPQTPAAAALFGASEADHG